MKERGNASSEPASMKEVTLALAKLSCWVLSENGTVLEGRYGFEHEDDALLLISKATHYASWHGWALSRVSYRDRHVLFRVGDASQEGVSRDHLLWATAIDALSAAGQPLNIQQARAGGVREEYRQLFEQYRSLSRGRLARVSGVASSLVPPGPTRDEDQKDSLGGHDSDTVQQRLGVALAAILAEHPMALRLAEQALTSASLLSPSRMPTVQIVDYICDGWSQVGLAAALAEDLPRARLATRLAERIQVAGSGDAPVAALTLMARAAALAPSEPKAALEAMVLAEHMLRGVKNSALLGWILIRKSHLQRDLGLPRAAVDALREGLRLIHPTRQRALFLRAHQALAELEADATPERSGDPGGGEELEN